MNGLHEITIAARLAAWRAQNGTIPVTDAAWDRLQCRTQRIYSQLVGHRAVEARAKVMRMRRARPRSRRPAARRSGRAPPDDDHHDGSPHHWRGGAS